MAAGAAAPAAQTSDQLDEFRARHWPPATTTTSKRPRGPASAADNQSAAGNDSSSGAAGDKAEQRAHRLPQLPECCTYDQVYARIIEMLSSAASSNDTALSRALVDELEVSSSGT
jgi:hypothetical protein